MSSPLERPLKFELRLPSSHPQLLEGLDIWLRLGLISDTQVRQLCREFLVCTVVLQPQPEAETKVAFVPSDSVQQLPVAALQSSSRRQPQQKPAKPNFISTMLQSLGAELSVRWLLFLGVFLVVVSSGVLAASQWERFPASGQYGVLFAYTLTFWGLSFWATRQSNLRLTAQTLLIVTLLLVPVNFWAMDSFRLWQNPVDWIVVAIACPTLTAITVLLSKNRSIFPNLLTGKLPLINILALSYLHWGWQLKAFPLIAVYVAMIGTTIITVYHNYQQPNSISEENRHRLSISLPAAVIIYALIVLLVRAIFVAKVDVTQLGLAIGICGWLVTWLAQKGETIQNSKFKIQNYSPSSPSSPSSLLLWERLGGTLLFLGWLVSVVNYPMSAIAVSALSLWFVGNRLRQYSLKLDFAAVFVIGLQTIWLGWRLVPDSLQKLAIAISTQLTNSQNEPWALLSIALFPYIILMVALTDRLHRTEKRELAKFGELLTLLFGAFLTTLAIVNPALRSLNLLFSTITLAFVTQRRSPASLPLIYLTHIMGVLTFCFTINWLLPTLSQPAWASILLALMVAEWVFSLSEGLWRRSAWYIGLGLAAASFFVLWMNVESSWYGIANGQAYWGVLWLVTPITLTGVASATIIERRLTSRYLSVLAVGVAQLLTLQLPETRLIGLAVGTGLMFANTRYLRNQISAVITEGFLLSFIVALLWVGVPGLPRLALGGWFVVGAIAILILWLAQTVLNRRGNELAIIYAAASDKWAIALCGFELFGLTLHSILIYSGFITSGFLYLAATAITLTAIVYRSWRQPTNWAFYGIGWSLELLTAQVLGFGEHSTVKIAMPTAASYANIALGLIAQLVGEWWRRRHQLERLPSSFHILPLIYGAFSVLLRVNTFTEWTGLYSLGVALIIIGVGRRREDFKPLLYLGIIGVSISAYELLFYQMLQASGGALGDGLIAMSALGASIMYAYRILSPWLVGYLRLTPQELKGIAHIHWAWSSCLLMAAIPLPIGVNRLVGLGTGVFLIRYAIFQGRNSQTSPSIFGGITIAEMWVYLGLLEVAGMRVYWRETAVGKFWAGPLVPWNGAIACVVAYFLYILPWENWGWSKKPWQQAAYIIPLIILWETRLQTYPITLVLAAGFYIFLAKVAENIRFTYVSVALIDWALYRWFDSLRLTDALWYVTPIGLSLLYIAQVDTQLKLPEYKTARHILRVLGSGLICGWAILFHQNPAWIPGIFSLIAIFAGLALRVRAFLYIGTATFLITTIYQSVIFSLQYSFLKWVVGLLVGILLIYIAANFETRRAQITSLIRSAIDEFQSWE
ncbi:DUF2157 domain-containing protein [Nostoc sphaeroides]|uniref:DUF2157 domain-containing protein n=1 Tax=Nostoc sphaeroides TaxID=446679 RepID=UPI0012699841|nr:DUF2157 domain-containing protein [Nostoc sphaeroides]